MPVHAIHHAIKPGNAKALRYAHAQLNVGPEEMAQLTVDDLCTPGTSSATDGSHAVANSLYTLLLIHQYVERFSCST